MTKLLYKGFACALVFTALTGYAKVSPNVINLNVKISWKTIQKCSNESPEIKIINLPKNTKYIEVSLSDTNVPSWNHGGGKVKYNGSNIIPKNALKNGYNGPCPPSGSHLYVFDVKAINKDGVIIGSGESKSEFP